VLTFSWTVNECKPLSMGTGVAEATAAVAEGGGADAAGAGAEAGAGATGEEEDPALLAALQMSMQDEAGKDKEGGA